MKLAGGALVETAPGCRTLCVCFSKRAVFDVSRYHAISHHPNDLVCDPNFELLNLFPQSLNPFPSVTYFSIDRIIILCYDFQCFLVVIFAGVILLFPRTTGLESPITIINNLRIASNLTRIFNFFHFNNFQQ
jgi:hypothetical protein